MNDGEGYRHCQPKGRRCAGISQQRLAGGSPAGVSAGAPRRTSRPQERATAAAEREGFSKVRSVPSWELCSVVILAGTRVPVPAIRWTGSSELVPGCETGWPSLSPPGEGNISGPVIRSGRKRPRRKGGGTYIQSLLWNPGDPAGSLFWSVIRNIRVSEVSGDGRAGSRRSP